MLPNPDHFNQWDPLKGVEATLYLQTDKTILSACQFSAKMTSESYMITALGVDGYHQHTTSLLKGRSTFLDLHGPWAGNSRLEFID